MSGRPLTVDIQWGKGETGAIAAFMLYLSHALSLSWIPLLLSLP